MMPDMDMSFETAQTIVVVDEYGKTEDGKPLKLTRTYDEIATAVEIAMSIDMGGETQDQDQSVESSSELEGLTVEFTWDEEEEEYVREFPDGDGDEELLEGLLEDMDLRALLPAGKVSKGDEWEIDPTDLIPVLAPGGDLSLEMGEEIEMTMGPSPGGMDFTEMLGDLLEGEATATFEGIREVDGLQIAVITIVVEIDSANDMTDMVADSMPDQELPEGMEMSIDRMDIEIELEAEGTLHWDVEGGHVQGRPVTVSPTGNKSLTGGIDVAVRGERILAAALAAAGRRRFRNRIAGQAARYWSEPTGSAWEANSHWRSGIGDQAWLEVGVDHWTIYETFARALNSPSPNTVMEWGAGGGANAVAFAPHAQRFIAADISQRRGLWRG